MPESVVSQGLVGIHVLRLMPGEDLKACLVAYVARQGLTAAFIITAVGSLSVVRLRFAGREASHESLGDAEIVTLVGTLGGLDGACHLHLSASDRDGQVRAGHLLEGSLVRTTAEVVLGSAPDLNFLRHLDARTGYPELCIERRPTEG